MRLKQDFFKVIPKLYVLNLFDGPIDPGNGGGGSIDEIKPDDKTRIED